MPTVTLLWDGGKERGSFLVLIDGVPLEMNPWVGVQLGYWLENGKDWHRDNLEKYIPNDLSNYLKKKEGENGTS